MFRYGGLVDKAAGVTKVLVHDAGIRLGACTDTYHTSSEFLGKAAPRGHHVQSWEQLRVFHVGKLVHWWYCCSLVPLTS